MYVPSHHNNKKRDVFLLPNNILITINDLIAISISVKVNKLAHIENEFEDEDSQSQATREKEQVIEKNLR